LLDSWGVDPKTDDQLQILAKSGGFQLTDTIELCEYRDSETDDLRQPLEFRVAGQQYHEDRTCDRAEAGDLVCFDREPENEHDRYAVRVGARGLLLGYVPRQYSRLFSRVLSGGTTVEGTLRRALQVPDEGWRWVIEAWAQ
jgi:hypothetical protein